jgi:hypothetical protein
MSIDERLRADLPAAVDDVRPDVDADLGALLRRAGRRSRVRRATYAAGLVAAAVVAAVVMGLTGDDARKTTEPVAPHHGVRVLDSGRGTPQDPAPLQPGRYVVPTFGGEDGTPWGQVDVPDGWGQDRIHLATGHDLDPHLRRIELAVIDRVAPDPCTNVMRPVGPTVDALVSALVRQRRVEPGTPRPVTVDGHPGQVVRFRVPQELEDCSESLTPFGYVTSWTSVFPGWTYRMWVIDVDGERLVIHAAHGPHTTRAELDELTAMVQGLRFVAPPG